MTPDEIDSSFEQFYRQYPKHVAKAAALKAYRAVISKKLATPEELLAGALRFAAERSGQDPQFTKHAQTWLNSQCWLDEPSRPAGNMIDGDGNPVIERPPPDRRQQSAYGPQFAAALETARRLADKGGQP